MKPYMSTDPAVILQNPEEWRIEWDEPLTGVTTAGKTVTRSIRNTVSVRAAIDAARFATLPHLLTDAELLREFLTTHWAWAIYSSPEQSNISQCVTPSLPCFEPPNLDAIRPDPSYSYTQDLLAWGYAWRNLFLGTYPFPSNGDSP